MSAVMVSMAVLIRTFSSGIHPPPLLLETLHTTFEWNCQTVVLSRICCGIAAGQLYPDNHSE